MAEIPLYYELHIRPMFREIDHLHMKRLKVDLWDAAYVKEHVDAIISFLTLDDPDQVMPAQDAGGPWPPEWIEVIKRWRDKFGAQSLPRGTGRYTVVKDKPKPGWYTLKATGSPSETGASVWLDRVPGRANPPDLVLYEEPPREGFAGSLDPFEVEDSFERGNATVVRVTDKTGTVEIKLT